MKLSIAGASVYGLGNISDDSMLQSFLGGLRERDPGLEVTLICRHPGSEVEERFGVKSIHNLDFPTKAESQGKRWRGFNQGDSPKHLAKLREELASSQALMIGGDPFDDSNADMMREPFRGIMPYTANLITLARYLQKKVVLFGIHLGRPPSSPYGIELAKFCLDNADLVTTREDDTKERIVSAYGTSPDKVVSSADSGFALLRYVKPAQSKQLAGLFAQKKLEPKQYIALTVRSYYWLWDEAAAKQYVAQFAAYADRLATRYQCKVLLVPHCAYALDNYWESDINFQREIYERCKNKDAVVPVGFYLTAPDLLFCIGQAQFVVSNRRHSGIYAALQGVPFYLFGEKGHVGKVYQSLGVEPKDFVDEKSLDRLFADTQLLRVRHALAAWDASAVRSRALVQEEKCRYATEAISALLHTQ